MNSSLKRIIGLASALAISLGVAGCGSMTPCQKGAAVGAGVGGVAGSVLSGGGTVGTVGGAVVGGAIGAHGRC